MAPTVVTTADAGAVESSVATPVRLRDLPLMYGTPTDLARTAAAASETVWTLDSEGVVLTYDRSGDFWDVAAHQDRATVLIFGTVRVARWGRPSGGKPDGVGVRHRSRTPTHHTPRAHHRSDYANRPGDSYDRTTPTGTTGSSTTPPSASTTPTSRPAGSNQVAAAPGGSKSGGSADGELSYTGINLGRLGLLAAELLTAGGAMLAFRRRWMIPNQDLASDAAPGTDSSPRRTDRNPCDADSLRHDPDVPSDHDQVAGINDPVRVGPRSPRKPRQ